MSKVIVRYQVLVQGDDGEYLPDPDYIFHDVKQAFGIAKEVSERGQVVTAVDQIERYHIKKFVPRGVEDKDAKKVKGRGVLYRKGV